MYADVDGVRIVYEAKGIGPALVFVHGWSAERSHWARQTEAFPGHRIVALDLPGHGQSDKPERPYPMELFARAVVAVMDSAGVEDAILVGHSNGVSVIREVLRMGPIRVSGWVAVDGWLRNPIAPEMAEWMRGMAASPEYETMMRSLVDRVPYGDLEVSDIERIKTSSLDTPAHVHRAGLEAMIEPRIWRDDPIEVPLLVVQAWSPQLTDDYEEFVRTLAPGVEFHAWEDVSHFIPLERPDELNALIRAFAERVELRQE